METPNFDTGNMELDKISHTLTTFSHVVTVILSYSNAQDLNRCARVCSLWSKVAKKLKTQRRTRAWTCLTCDDTADDEVITEQTKQFFLNLYTEPKIVFMFCQSDFYESFSETECCTTRSQTRITKPADFGEYVRKLLPSSCTFVGIGSGGVVGTSPDLRQMLEVEEERGVSFLCLPRYEGVEIDCDDTNESAEELSTGLDITEILHVENRDECKAIFSFISDPHLSRQIGFDLMNEYTNSLIAGGYVDTIIPTDGEDFTVLKCVALCGKNLHVASCVIRENVNTPSKAEDSIKKLKAQNLSEANSFAFMFACVGRGAGMYGEPDVESSIFKKHFPKTPLFGFFGNGEIGFEFVSGRDECSVDLPEKKKKKSPPRLYHAYTTILVLVSITSVGS